jgi:uncharacterized protein (TIGR02596 family)
MRQPSCKPGQRHSRCQIREGFSLVELLVVIAIMSILLVVAVPAVNSVQSAANIGRAGQIVGDSIALGRQEAVAKNREVEVRFYNFSTPQLSGWKGIQVFRVEQTTNGRVEVPITQVKVIPNGVMISASATVSPLLTADTTSTGSTNLKAYGNTGYAGFSFRPEGSISGAINDNNNYLTLQNGNATGTPPPNYCTLQINQITGKVTTFRP